MHEKVSAIHEKVSAIRQRTRELATFTQRNREKLRRLTAECQKLQARVLETRKRCEWAQKASRMEAA